MTTQGWRGRRAEAPSPAPNSVRGFITTRSSCLGPLRIRKTTPVTVDTTGSIQVLCPAGRNSALPPNAFLGSCATGPVHTPTSTCPAPLPLPPTRVHLTSTGAATPSVQKACLLPRVLCQEAPHVQGPGGGAQGPWGGLCSCSCSCLPGLVGAPSTVMGSAAGWRDRSEVRHTRHTARPRSYLSGLSECVSM